MSALGKRYYYYETNLYRGNVSRRKVDYGHQQKRKRDDYTGDAEPSPWLENAVRNLEDGR